MRLKIAAFDTGYNNYFKHITHMMKVAIQGFEGCFHHIAAEEFFGTKSQSVEIVPCGTFRALATTLLEGRSDAAVMAIENSIAGSILPNYNILQNSSLKVVGEIYLQIQQNLLVLPDVELEDIQEVQSHPMALLQCTDYLDDKGWRLIETEDTALSAKHIAEHGLRTSAAVAGYLPAQLYGLKILVPQINTIHNNHTRFLVLTRSDDDSLNPPQINKASLYFTVSHTHGSLNKVLKSMELYEMNMTKLQSYPIPTDPWHYIFHLDMEFSSLEQYRAAIGLMSHHSEEFCVYGEYESAAK